MIVRHINDKEVTDSRYIAHGGALAEMVLDGRVLKELGFFALAILPPGNEIEPHRDVMEEIYFILEGKGEMRVDDERRELESGSAIWIPVGALHGLVNTGEAACVIIVVASRPDLKPSDMMV